ncbi:cytosolic Fe-S cluster assembly factor NUBP2-like protein [Vairimorpha necatrix]|uniref:Cytosolic Fe-S cluster assembly factor NUBP2-like protein n=1 Tax=Vairimorpha necatrix TaxID=6039 RepID=A0AAX4JDG2_9MICR
MVNKIAVMSGKGGVGKSSLSILLSMILSESKKCLLLDFDICGPSCVTSLGGKGQVKKGSKGLIPIKITDNLHVLSMGSMINKEDAVIWRGPKKLSLLNLFYESIDDYDFVIIDTPPGISEEHDFLVNKNIKSLIVTTSQNVALSDTVKAIEFCQMNNIEILGVIENMSGYKCKKCKHITNIFASRGGEKISEYYKLQFVSKLPVEPEFGKMLDKGEFKEKYKDLETYKILKENITRIL